MKSKHLNCIIAGIMLVFGCLMPQQMAAKEKSDCTVKNVAGGKIRGIEENGVLVFKGVPYAMAPVGEFRWQDPQPVVPWKGVKKCDTFGKISIQAPQDPNGLYGKEFYSAGLPEMGEDCLYLNIYAPKNAHGKNLPVAMWIHGGAFAAGYGHEITMDGTEWAKRDVILVTINYRLGNLGFLSHPLLSEEQNGSSGNYGLKDQLAALHWIYDNIGEFGGNPNNITIMGQSAGAIGVRTLVTCPEAVPMIAKAVIQSGGGFESPIANFLTRIPEAQMEEGAKKTFDAAGCETLEKMRNLSVAELQAKVEEGTKAGGAIIPFPHIGDRTFPIAFDEAVKNGSIADIPYLIGCVSGDGDALGGESIDNFASMRSENGTQPVYQYIFKRNLPGDDENPETDPGAFHSGELWYMFGTLGKSWRPFTEDDYKLSEEMLDAWTSFAKDGNPGWTPSKKGAIYIKEFDVKH